MGLFSRLGALIKSNLNDLISKAEDPEKMLNQVLVDMKTQLVEAKKQVAVAIGDEKRLKKQWDEIDELQSKVKGIKLLKGIESDILEDGSLDYPDSVLEKLDVVIGSIHQRYSQDEAAMTKRVLNAFDNPHLHIWGHPSGRLLLKREAAPMRMEEILDKAAKKGIVVEVNGCPDRMDLASEWVRKALERKIKLVISTDAHSVHELTLHLPYAIAAARRGWAPPRGCAGPGRR